MSEPFRVSVLVEDTQTGQVAVSLAAPMSPRSHDPFEVYVCGMSNPAQSLTLAEAARLAIALDAAVRAARV